MIFHRWLQAARAEKKIKWLGELKIYRSKAETEDELIERLKESEVVISTRAFTHLNGKILASCPGLRMISILSAYAQVFRANFSVQFFLDKGSPPA